jgi:hypothetical protein
MLDQAGIMIAPISTRNIDIIIAAGRIITATYGSNITTKGLQPKNWTA